MLVLSDPLPPPHVPSPVPFFFLSLQDLSATKDPFSMVEAPFQALDPSLLTSSQSAALGWEKPAKMGGFQWSRSS